MVMLQLQRGYDQGLQGPGNSEGERSGTPAGAFPQPLWVCVMHPSGKEPIQSVSGVAQKLKVSESDLFFSSLFFPFLCVLCLALW